MKWHNLEIMPFDENGELKLNSVNQNMIRLFKNATHYVMNIMQTFLSTRYKLVW